MTHGFSQHDWLDYTSGELDRERTLELERHIASCHACAEKKAQLAQLDRRLETFASQLRAHIEITPAQVREALRSFEKKSPQSALILLQLFVARVCGSGTASRALQLAARRVKAESAEAVTPAQWPAFVETLSSIIGTLCGEPSANLLQAIGSLT